MPGENYRHLFVRSGAITLLLLFSSSVARGQDGSNTRASGMAAEELTKEVRTLSETVRELQSQVQSLTSQIGELRSRGQLNASSPTDSKTSESLKASRSVGPSGLDDSYLTFPAGIPASTQSNSSTFPDSSALPKTLEDRVSQLEDNQQLTDSKLSDQYQTKVESGSKYRVRLSGIVLLNMFSTRGVVDNADFPEIALESNPLDSAGSFGGSLRQSQIGLQVFGPDVAGARTSADIKFDFAGGFPTQPNGAILGLVRLRTGTIRMDWTNTSIIAGQDFLFFAPLAPTSLSSFAVPALSYAGDLWGWTPQVRIEHRINFSDHSSLLLQGGILDSLTGDLPFLQSERYPSWGEASGQPAYASRIAWSQKVFGQNMTLGAGGYYGRQFWGLGRHIDGWVGTMDLTLPLGKYFGFTGEFYRGRAVGGLGAAIGQGVLLGGPLTSPVTIAGLDSIGGWAQLKFKPIAKFEVNAAVGDDNPFASEFRRFPSTDSYYGVPLTRNFSPFVNFIYQLRSNVMFSVEYRRLKTYQFDDGAYTADQTNVSLGYIF